MEHIHNQEEAIEDIVNSLDNISRAEAPPFFYTRLQGRIQKPEEPQFLQQLIGFITKPAFAVVSLSLFVVLNVVAISSVFKSSKGAINNNIGTEGSLQSFEKEYDLSVSTLYSDSKTNE